MTIRKDQAKKVVQKKADNGSTSLSVSTPRQKKLLTELLQVANTDSFSQDIYEAIEFYLKEKNNG